MNDGLGSSSLGTSSSQISKSFSAKPMLKVIKNESKSKNYASIYCEYETLSPFEWDSFAGI